MNKITKIRDFHGSRSTGVGSSDIPILAGMSKRYGSTTLKLWERKTGRQPEWQGNERTRVGNDLEAYVLRRFIEDRYGADEADAFYLAARRGRSYREFKSKTEARHPERAYCLAHADLVVECRADIEYNAETMPEAYIVEAKTVGAYAAKRREGEIFSGYDMEDMSAQGIPDAVYLQVQWQMYCYGISEAYVAALIDNQYGCWGPIEADKRTQESALALAERFWRLVETDTTPAPETWDDVCSLYPHSSNTTAMVGGDDEHHVREMISRDKDLAARIKKLESERDDIKNAIGVMIGGNQVLASAEGDILAKASEQTRETVSLSKIKKDLPDIAAQLETAGIITKSNYRQVRY
jgi:predicted phage-related endonuclease